MEQTNQPKASADPNKWKPGTYRAKPIDWNCTITQAGLPQVTVLFTYEQPGDMPGVKEPRQLAWYGSFKGGALERTIETLANLGLKQPPFPAMESGCGGNALDINAEVDIVVEHRIDQKGVKRAGVSWVNRVGGGVMQSKLKPGQGEQVFAEANQAFAQFMQSKGVQMQAPAASAGGKNIADQIASGQSTMTDEDIPF